MTHLIINLGNKKIEREAYISYTDNHIVLAFQPKDNMSEISRFITYCLNNGDLLEKFTLQFDKKNIETNLKESSIDFFCYRKGLFELRLNRAELKHKNKSTNDCIVINLPPKQIDGLTEESKQKTIKTSEWEIVFCYNDEVNNDTKVKMYSQKHTFEKNTSPINLCTKGGDVAEFIQYAHLNHSHINDMPRYIRQFVDSYYVSEPQRFNMLFAMASSYAEYILEERNKGGGDLVKCTINHFQIDGLEKIKDIIQNAGLKRNGKNISCLTDLRNESEHNLYSDDSYVFFDKYPSVNLFMEEIACKIVMKLAGLKLVE